MKAFLATLFVCFLTGCSSFLYHPSSELLMDYHQGEYPHEDLYFKSANGSLLHAVHFKGSQLSTPKALILFFHGNGENLSSHFATLYWLLEYSYDFLIFDYQGYGTSEGKPSPEKTVQDGMAAIQFANGIRKGTPLIIFGQSLGGVVALRSLIELKSQIPMKIPVRWVVIDSSFMSYRAAARSVMARSWLTWPFQPLGSLVMCDEWSVENRMQDLPEIPLLVIHGKRDAVIEYDLGEKLFNQARFPKEMWTIEEGRHTDLFWRHKGIYRKRFLEKLAQFILPNPSS